MWKILQKTSSKDTWNQHNQEILEHFTFASAWGIITFTYYNVLEHSSFLSNSETHQPAFRCSPSLIHLKTELPLNLSTKLMLIYFHFPNGKNIPLITVNRKLLFHMESFMGDAWLW